MRLSALTALSFLLLVSPVVALTIIEEDSVTVTGAGISGKYAADGAVIDAMLSFVVKEEYENILIDFSALGDGQRQVAASSCPARRCSVPVHISVAFQGGKATIPFAVYAEGGVHDADVKYSLLLDTQPPRILGLGTESMPDCRTSCALRPGEVVLVASYTDGSLTSPGSGIAPDTIWLLSPDAEEVPASWCNATQCNFTVALTAGTQPRMLRIAQHSADAMGNEVTGVLENTFTVDGDKPRLSSLSVKNLNSNRDVPVMTGSFQVRLVVEDASKVIAFLDTAAFTELPDGVTENWTEMSCLASGDCTLRITPREGSYKGTMRYRVIDVAGNELSGVTDEIYVTKSTAEAGDFWRASTRLQPASLDKGTAKFFKKVFTMPLQLTRSESDARIALVSADECRLSQDEKNIGITIGVDVLGRTTQTPSIQLLIPATSVFDELSGDIEVTCKIAINTVKGDTYYERPEYETVTAELHLVKYPLIAEKINELQARQQKEYEDSLTSLNKLKNIYTVASTMCGGIAGVTAGATALTQTQQMLGGAQIPGATAVRVASDKVSSAGETFSKSAVGTPLCWVASCKGQQWLNNELFYQNNQLGDAMKKLSKYGAGSSPDTGGQYVNWLDPYKSEIVALGTACLPAIVHHREMRLGIDCNFNACVTTQVGHGVPLSSCYAQRSNMQCRYTGGGVYNAFPPAAVFETLRDNVLNLVKNPFSGAIFASTVSCALIGPNILNANCKLPKLIDNMHEHTQTLAQLNAAAQAFNQNTVQDACQLADDRIQQYHANLQGGADCNVNYCVSGNIVEINGKKYRIEDRALPFGSQTPPPEGAKTSPDNSVAVTSGSQPVTPQPVVPKQPEVADYADESNSITQEQLAAYRADMRAYEESVKNYPAAYEQWQLEKTAMQYYQNGEIRQEAYAAYQARLEEVNAYDPDAAVAQATQAYNEVMARRGAPPVQQITCQRGNELLKGSSCITADPNTEVVAVSTSSAEWSQQQIEYYLLTGKTLVLDPSISDTDPAITNGREACDRQGVCLANNWRSGNSIFGPYQKDADGIRESFESDSTTVNALVEEAQQEYETFRTQAVNLNEAVTNSIESSNDAGSGSFEVYRAHAKTVARRMLDEAVTSNPAAFEGVDFEKLYNDIDTRFDKAKDTAEIDVQFASSRLLRETDEAYRDQLQTAEENREAVYEKHHKDMKNLADQIQRGNLQSNTDYAFSSAMKAAIQWQDIAQTASQFGLNLPGFMTTDSALGKKLDSKTDLEDAFLDDLCDGRVQRDSVILGLDPRLRIGLTLYGTVVEGDEFLTEDEDTTQYSYQYVVGGQILFSPDKKDNYTITIEGQGGAFSLYEGESSNSFGQGNLLSTSSEDKYTKACIEFATKQVQELFDTEQTDVRGRKVCVPLKVRS